MARDEDFLAAATAAAQALTTARNALQVAQAAAAREFPQPPDLAPLIDGIVRAMQGLRLPVPAVTVGGPAAPQIIVQAAQAPNVSVEPHFAVNVPEQMPAAITVEAPVVNVAAPSVTVQAPQPAEVRVEPHFEVSLPEQPAPVVNVAAPVVQIEPQVVNVAAPSVSVQVPEAVPPPRLPWRMEVHRDPRTQLIVSADIVPVLEAA